MDAKKIETLVMLLVVALVIQFLGSKGVYFFFLNASDAATSGDMEIHDFASALKYQQFAGSFLALLVNFVIGYWLYVNSGSRKLLWAALGLFAKWWALPLFAYYIYTQRNERT